MSLGCMCDMLADFKLD